MYVVDTADEKKKIFAYNQPLSGNAWLKTLTPSGDIYYGAQPFKLSNPTTHYDVWVDHSTSTTTIIAGAQDPNAVSVKIAPKDADSNANGHQIALGAGNNPIRITVTAKNGDSKLYSVNISKTRPSNPSPELF